MPYSNVVRTLLLPFLAVALLMLGWAAARAEPIPPPPQVPVRGYILLDHQSGNVLAEMKSDERMEPASITKLMTGYVVYKALKSGKIHLNDQVTISEKAWRTSGSKMFIKLGTQVSVEDLLMGMVVQSGNDATVALAEHVAGSEETFVKLMNQEAERLGMKNSHFTNAPGLPDPNHYMSARDIATLTQALIRDFPDQYARYSVRSFKYNNIEQQNRNRLLLTDSSVDGVKTGHTESAGYCLVSSAKRDDTRLIGVVLGAQKEKGSLSGQPGAAELRLQLLRKSQAARRQRTDRDRPDLEGPGKRAAAGRDLSIVRDRAEGPGRAGQHHDHGATDDHRAGPEGSVVRRDRGQAGRPGSEQDAAGGAEGGAGKRLVRTDDRRDPVVLPFPVQLSGNGGEGRRHER